MNPTPHDSTGEHSPGRQNRHGEGPLQTNRYSELEILEFNRLHDSKLGWSQDYPTIYTKASRRPESVYVPAKDVWKERV